MRYKMMAKVDEKSRVVITKNVREMVGLSRGKRVRVKVAGKSIVIKFG